MKLTTDHRSNLQKYSPVPIGNGDLSALIDHQGIQSQRSYGSTMMVPGILRAGVRYDSSRHDLIPFGYFDQEFPGGENVAEWSQSLDPKSGLVETVCRYENGLTVETSVFCHLKKNVIAVRKKFSAETPYTFRHHFGKPRHIRRQADPESMTIRYEADELFHYRGGIMLKSSVPMERRADDSELALHGGIRQADFFLVFLTDDEKPEPSYDWDDLYASSCALWNEYWSESWISIPSEPVMKTYYASQYHLRISATRWSVPIGIFSTHWDGRFFGFDEFYVLASLLSSGHLDIARRILEFRYKGLPFAAARTACGKAERHQPAFYPWETLEDGSEGAPWGFWLDHVFHQGVVALSAYRYFQASRDLDFLREKGYPVIAACAEYFRRASVYPDGKGNLCIGSCADYEKLGSMVRNPFATSCAAISTFRIAADAANRLGEDEDLARQWLDCSEKLLRTLPNDGEKFLPYPDCRERSISAFASLFPYRIFPDSHPMQRATILDALANSGEYANQYKAGKYTTTWYAAIQAYSMTRFDKKKEARELLESTVTRSGCFAELFEVWEMGRLAWFSTAEGMFINAVNQLLLSAASAADGGWDDAHFRLMDETGRIVER